MIATCCGESACFDCFKTYLVENAEHKLVCPYCGDMWQQHAPKIKNNPHMQRLLDQELLKDLNPLTKEERE